METKQPSYPFMNLPHLQSKCICYQGMNKHFLMEEMLLTCCCYPMLILSLLTFLKWRCEVWRTKVEGFKCFNVDKTRKAQERNNKYQGCRLTDSSWSFFLFTYHTGMILVRFLCARWPLKRWRRKSRLQYNNFGKIDHGMYTCFSSF